MMQTLNPYTGTSTARTAEIMARYRPIAPRPLVSSGGHESDSPGSASGSGSPASSMSPTIRQSPYLRNVWPHLQSRPTRTRKRGRTSLGPPPSAGAPSFKRPRTLLQGLSPPYHATTSPASLVTLPLLPSSSLPHQPNMRHQPDNDVMLDINKLVIIPEEKDLLGQFQKSKPTVISPTPIRLIPSTVSIRSINPSSPSIIFSLLKKNPEEIEKDLESELLPAFVSDSNNKVRLVNSAYKQMVGQPECSWIDSMVTADGLGVACKAICGEVVLNFMDQDVVVSSRGGFSCWTQIEWGENVNENNKKNLVNGFGEAIRLACESKDYKFAWRFHTRETSDPTVSM